MIETFGLSFVHLTKISFFINIVVSIPLVELHNEVYTFGRFNDNVFKKCGNDIININSSGKFMKRTSQGVVLPDICNTSIVQLNDNMLMLYGGKINNNLYNNDVYLYNIDTNVWYATENLNTVINPIPRENPILLSNVHVYMIGGTHENDELTDIWKLKFYTDEIFMANNMYSYIWEKLELIENFNSFGRIINMNVNNQSNELIIISTCGLISMNLNDNSIMNYRKFISCYPIDVFIDLYDNELLIFGGCDFDSTRCYKKILSHSLLKLDSYPEDSGDSLDNYIYDANVVRMNLNKFMIVGENVEDDMSLVVEIKDIDKINLNREIFCKNGVYLIHNKICECNSDYFKVDCSLKKSYIQDFVECSNNGIKGAFDRCKCFYGFYGPLCQFGKQECRCNPKLYPSNGYCNRDGSCSCLENFIGQDCSIKLKCPNNCCGKGVCTPYVNKCVCNFGFYGDDCAISDDFIKDHQNYIQTLISSISGEPNFKDTHKNSMKLLENIEIINIHAIFDKNCNFQRFVENENDIHRTNFELFHNFLKNQVAGSNNTSGSIISGESFSKQTGRDIWKEQEEYKNAMNSIISQNNSSIVNSESSDSDFSMGIINDRKISEDSVDSVDKIENKSDFLFSADYSYHKVSFLTIINLTHFLFVFIKI